VALAIQAELYHDATVQVWTQDAIRISSTVLDDLIDCAWDADFAIFVLAPDDAATMRTEAVSVVRDNVLFEFGLFLGRLGRARCFGVMPIGCPVHLPSDLSGLTMGEYRPDAGGRSLRASWGPFCRQGRAEMRRMGRVDATLAEGFLRKIAPVIEPLLHDYVGERRLDLARLPRVPIGLGKVEVRLEEGKGEADM